ncbi:MAG: segregation/condensation protein A [Candidatus Hydrogenedentes bacterium]|nr:segregation/condensation protein A [Candidatus Hydrogenedentota bacterium]MBI3118805.1 segregation/condensation protein A [Candidatus Hydrogenedentota bacterium]
MAQRLLEKDPPAPTAVASAASVEVLDIANANDEVLRLQLDKFEGPFEVLLYLIRSQEIDIFDIPILKVTEQYLRFLELMHEQNLDMAGDFLVMAATLIQIKARMLMPVDVVEEEEELEEDDPRLELVEKLLEYRKFRDLSILLTQREEERADWFPRRVKLHFDDADEEEDYLEVSLYDLLKAIRAMLRYVTEPYIHEVHGEGASVEDKIAQIEALLESNESVSWTELFNSAKTRVELVCCLLAILELCRMRRIRAHQHRNFGEIRIFLSATKDEPDVVAVS